METNSNSNVDLESMLENTQSQIKFIKKSNDVKTFNRVVMTKQELVEIVDRKMGLVKTNTREYEHSKQVFRDFFNSTKDDTSEETFDYKITEVTRLCVDFIVLTGLIKIIKTDINDLVTMSKLQFREVHDVYNKTLSESLDIYKNESFLLNQISSSLKYLKDSKYKKSSNMNITDYGKM